MNRDTRTILKRLRGRGTLGGVDLPSDFILPDYEGYSLANVPSTILEHFGLTDVPALPLADEIVGRELEGCKKIVVLLVDALGYLDLASQMAGDPRLQGFRQLAERGRFTPITSIFPSTTAAVVSTFHTGLPPVQHGITGYRMYMPEHGFIANMIRLSPEADERPSRLIQKAGDARRLLGVPTVHSRLVAGGVKSFCLIQDTICNSGLSQMIFQGATKVIPFVNSSDMLVRIRDMVNSEPDTPAVVWAYWGAVDSLQHQYGTWGPAPEAEVRNFGYSLQRELLEPLLKQPSGQKSALMLLADHGQVQTNIEDVVDVRRAKGLVKSLAVPPTGTGRSPYLYLREGKRAEVGAALTKLVWEKGLVVDSSMAIENGLWGEGKIRSGFSGRVGDLVVLMKAGHSLFYPYRPDSRPDQVVGGRHGGLHEKEMLVPFFCTKLG